MWSFERSRKWPLTKLSDQNAIREFILYKLKQLLGLPRASRETEMNLPDLWGLGQFHHPFGFSKNASPCHRDEPDCRLGGPFFKRCWTCCRTCGFPNNSWQRASSGDPSRWKIAMASSSKAVPPNFELICNHGCTPVKKAIACARVAAFLALSSAFWISWACSRSRLLLIPRRS